MTQELFTELENDDMATAEHNGALAVQSVDNPLTIIERAMERGADADQLEKLMALQERWEKNEAAKAFAAALTEFQSKCPVIHKSRQATGSGRFDGYSYASYDDIMRQAGPVLEKCGLALSFSTDHNEKGIRVTCRVRHGTHFEDHTLTVPVPSSMPVNDTQKYGAALSYAKRYALCAALNIVVSDEDNDAGNLGETVDDKQLSALQDLYDSKADVNWFRFKKFFNIESMGDMPKSRYDEAMTFLSQKPNK